MYWLILIESFPDGRRILPQIDDLAAAVERAESYVRALRERGWVEEPGDPEPIEPRAIRTWRLRSGRATSNLVLTDDRRVAESLVGQKV